MSLLEVAHYDPCFSLALVLQQFLGYRVPHDRLSEFVQSMFSTMGRISHCSYRESVPPENGGICIFAEPFASDAYVVRPGNGVISEQLQGKSATRLSDMQIQK